MALWAILCWYLVIGVLAAIGSVTISRSRFAPRVEHIFFALLLALIAAMYLVFVAYFGDSSSLQSETRAAAVFAALGLLGLRLPALLVLGYALHGGWDLAHEIWMHRGDGPGGAGPLTNVPLAYGVFCAAYDWCIAGYLFTRRAAFSRREGEP